MEFNKRTAYIYVKTNPGQLNKVFEQFRKHEFVIGAWAVTGDYDCIAWVNAKNDDDIYNWANTMKNWEGIDYTTSHFVHNGYIQNFDQLHSPAGVWLRLRTNKMDVMPAIFKDHPYVASWANVPGEYDFVCYLTGENLQKALENVVHLTENHNWKTYTHVPVYTYLNDNYRNKL